MDEFDHALMEALNEAVPPAGFATNLADRLVARTRRRARFWKLLFALGLFSAAGTVITATALSTGTMDVSSVENTGTDVSPVENTGTTGVSPVETGTPPPAPSALNSQLSTLNSQQGAPQVQSNTLKKAAALTGAIALAAATPVRADGYQFIVSGYPAANECQTDYSDGIALETATCRSVTDASELEARYRTRDVSSGIALNTTEYKAMVIIIR